jgi:hypothetical protein
MRRCEDLVWIDVLEERIASNLQPLVNWWLSLQQLVHAGSSLMDFFYPEDGGRTFLQNIGTHEIYTV